ncbi:MAG: hypothetical protein ABI183_22410 [Polyangiaceae bacterium]
MRAATSALPWVLGLAIVSCNAISGIGDLTRANDDTTTDGGSEGGAPCGGADLASDANNCGTCGHACGTGNYCSASACVQGCTGGILYVSSLGADTSTGCTTTSPLKTISHALTLAKAQGNALVQEVHVCKGTYKEPQITVDFKSSLRGGYDCTAWKRTATFGYPMFDPSNATEIDSSATTGTSIITVAVGGSAVDASVIVDGFSIHGSSSGSTTIALALNGGSPSIQNDQIVGGTFSEATAAQASIGVQISAGASPEIMTSTIDGGGGTTTSSSTSSIGSVGISIASDSGSPSIHGASISGGSGSALVGDGSIGIAVNGGSFATINAIRQNTISGGTGNVVISGVASVGIVSVASGNVELDANDILGGSGSCAKATGNCSMFGIVAGVGSLILRGNKIYGGDATGSVNGGSAGVTVSGLKSFIAENNMIHGGNKDGSATHGSTAGIQLTQTAAPSMRSNTIYSGNCGSTGTASAADIVIQPQVSAIVATNNLFATSGSRDTALLVSCTPNLMTSFQNNVALAPTDIVVYSGGGSGTCGATAQSYTTMKNSELFLVGTASPAPTVSANQRLLATAAQCGLDTSCTATTGCDVATDCNAAVLTGWTATDSGFTILQNPGWKINALCPVSHGGLDISATLKADFYGAARTSPLSVGADENDDVNCTN